MRRHLFQIQSSGLFQSESISFSMAIFTKCSSIRNIVYQFRKLAIWFYMVSIKFFTVLSAHFTSIIISLENIFPPKFIFNCSTNIFSFFVQTAFPKMGFLTSLRYTHFYSNFQWAWNSFSRPSIAFYTSFRKIVRKSFFAIHTFCFSTFPCKASISTYHFRSKFSCVWNTIKYFCNSFPDFLTNMKDVRQFRCSLTGTRMTTTRPIFQTILSFIKTFSTIFTRNFNFSMRFAHVLIISIFIFQIFLKGGVII